MAHIIPRQESPIIEIKNFRGINQSDTPTQIGDAESPDLLNMVLDQQGRLDKRTGYERVFTDPLGTGRVNGLYAFKKAGSPTVNILAYATELYTWDAAGSAPVQIYTGKADAITRFFTFGGYCYIMDGTYFLRYDGTTVTAVESAAYVPTLTLGRQPAGGGTPFENFNLLGAGFKDSFSGDGTTKIYQLSLTNLDATAVTATVGGVAMTEGAGFTVNRTTGVVTFTTAPATGVANNVVITAYKTQAGYADRVKRCMGFEIYGGTNDTRVFLFGHPDYPNVLRRCGLQDPTYFPELAFANVGSDAGKITRLAKQFSRCNIIKEPTPNDTTIYSMNFELDNNGVATFPIIPLNSIVGCNAPDSLQLIENVPTFISPDGVYGIVGSNVSDERNVERISDPISRSLLAETGLSSTVSVDFENKYILAINGNCYVYDYKHQSWYVWNNIPATCFFEIDRVLYFGAAGMVYRFTPDYMDDGEAIKAYWKSKVFSFNDDEHLKLVEKVFFSLNPSVAASADLYYETDVGGSGSEPIATMRVDILDFRNIRFDNFTFTTAALPQEFMTKLKVKKIVYFQIIVRNENANESMGILSIGMKVRSQREVK